MSDAPRPSTSVNHTAESVPRRTTAGHRPLLPLLGACGCGSGCTCGCQSGGACQCGGGCG